MSASYYLTDNCVPRRQLGSCSVTRPFLSAKGVAYKTSASDCSHTCTCSLVRQMWHKLAHWYATNYLEYANCLKLIQNPSLYLHVDFVVFSKHKVPTSEGSNEGLHWMSLPKYPLQQVTDGFVQCCEEGKVSCMLVRCPGNELHLLPETVREGKGSS